MNQGPSRRYQSTVRTAISAPLLLALIVSAAACGSSGKDSKNGSSSTKGNAQAGSTGSSDGNPACMNTADPGDMVSVPAGDFVMGCNAAVDQQCSDDEKPKHTVTLSAFEIDRTEVTQAAYAACVMDGACEPASCDWNCDNADFPATCVTWSQATSYCTWAKKRLPTEAEWEKAARGEEGNKYPWGNDEPDCTRANMAGCGNALKAVGGGAPSPYGAVDMAGNVVEFVSDFYDAKYYANSPAQDPKGPASGKQYGGRGGGFKSDAEYLRTSKRDWYDPTDAAPSLGFRCAR